MPLTESKTNTYAGRTNCAARFGVLFCLLATLAGSFANGGANPRRVLLLHSYGREFAPFNSFSESFRTELARQFGEPLEFYDVALESALFEGQSAEGSFTDYLGSLFKGSPLDLLVPIGGPAALFAQRHRNSLFPDTPMLIAASDQRHLQQAAFTTNDACLAVSNDVPAVVENILQVLPKTTNVAVVIGRSPLERFWKAELSKMLAPFSNRVSFAWLDDLSLVAMEQRAASMASGSAILFVLLSVDADGIPLGEDRALRKIGSVASAPVFGLHTTQLGKGIVGGPLLDIDRLSRDTAMVGVRILRGEPAASIKTPVQVPSGPFYDWRELRRWGIPEGRLPAGSQVRFRQPAVWERYWWQIALGMTILCAQTILVFGLVANIAKRRRAERTMRELSGRLINAQEEERARVAKELHDELSQNLALLAIEMETVGQQLPKNAPELGARLEGLSAQTKGISMEVHRISHALHPAKLTQLGLEVAVRGFCREIEGAHELKISFEARDVPRVLPADVALCLYRVTQEALQNIVKHSGANNASVRLTACENSIELWITDDGDGFDTSAIRARGSLGLVGMSERVRLVHGQIAVESKPGEGTHVFVRVPLPNETPQ